MKITNSKWPIAAASRIRIKFDNDTFCRLFYNDSTGSIDLVPLTADEATSATHAEIYDHSQTTNVEEDSDYQSYLKQQSKNECKNKHIADSFHPDDVIGANLSLDYNVHNPNTFHGMQSYASAQINIYCYPTSKAMKKQQRRQPNHKKYLIDSKCCEDFGDARSLIQSIRSLSGLHHVSSPKRFLVILNPYSGGNRPKSKSGASNVYNTMVKPMLEQAGLEHDVLATKRGGHAMDRMKLRKLVSSLDDGIIRTSSPTRKEDDVHDDINGSYTDLELRDISEYDAIIALGGDGILYEIFQGIHARSDEQKILSKLKFGIIPCGTCNGLARSILYWSDNANFTPLESVFQICKGYTSQLDLASYQLAKTDKTYISFLSFSWGLIADCDLESECLRCLGATRTDIWAVYRGILFPKRYRARFSYLPPPPNFNITSMTKIDMPKFTEPLPEDWVTIDDDIRVFWVCNTTHASYNVFTCPMSKMNDGLFHVLIVRLSCSRFRLLQMLLKLESGGHIECDGLEIVRCLAYRLEPLSNNTYNDLDGEMIEDGPIQASIFNTAQFFVGK